MTNLNLSNSLCIPSLKLLGDFWSLRIIDALSDGELRYCDLQRQVDNVNPVTLTDRLKKLQVSQIIARNEHSRAEVTYQLTELGKKAVPILEAVNNFSASAKRQADKTAKKI